MDSIHTQTEQHAFNMILTTFEWASSKLEKLCGPSSCIYML